MTYSGYLLTEDPKVALALCGPGGVRYAAELTDGRGFAAFEVDRELLYELGTLGEVLVESDPNYPDSWPDWARTAPHKKFESTLENRFVLYPAPQGGSARAVFEDFMKAYRPKAGALVSDSPFGRFYIIIEDGPDWTCDIEPIWDCGVVRFEDARVLA